MYLLFGSKMALLQDTGAGNVDPSPLIAKLIQDWANQRKAEPPPLLVVHSHPHGDHIAFDPSFKAMPNVELVPADQASIRSRFKLDPWPQTQGSIDLGDRVVDLIPIPGHTDADLALYDRNTALLLTGDVLYPGRLYIRDLSQFVASIDRLVEFTATRPVAHILGTHIEQSRIPYQDDLFKGDSKNPPFDPMNEHVLELSRGELLELQAELKALNGTPARVRLRSFTLWPVKPRE